MRKMIVLGAVAVLLTGSAKAADLPAFPYKALPAAAPVAYSWTGFYLGGNVGWGVQNGSEDLSGVGGLFAIGNLSSSNVPANGFLAGGQVGLQQRFGGAVLGVETDMDYSGIKGTGTPIAAGPNAITTGSNLRWLGSTRLRAGLLLTEQTLAYVTGGVAYGGTDANANFSLANGGMGLNLSNTRVGWTAGLGVEHVFANHFTLGAEARYYDLGTPTVTDPTGTVTLTNRFNGALGVIRAGYQF